MIRVRAITDHLDYDNLVKKAIIPDLVPIIQQVNQSAFAIKRYPPFVYKNKGFPFFGILLDYVIRAGLRINLAQKIDLGIDPVTNVIQSMSDDKIIQYMSEISMYETSKNMNDIARSTFALGSLTYGSDGVSSDDFMSYVPNLVNMVKDIVVKWQQYTKYLDGTIKFNTEYCYQNFAGHPDVVTDNCVLDIKTTTSFLKMSKESCLQVLAYFALTKPTHPNMKYIGFILPMQRDIALIDVSNWDSSKYLEFLSSEANKLETNPNDDIINLLTQYFVEAFQGLNDPQGLNDLDTFDTNTGNNNNNIITGIGHHIAKGKDISNTLNEYGKEMNNLPCQLFLCNPRTGRRNAKTANQINKASEIIRNNNMNVFIHAPYVINMSANECDEKGEYWQQRILNEDLMYAVRMGCKGVVVHTGARRHRTVDEALQIMEYMTRTALQYATEDCPLLLETPCGEGTEIVTKIEELGNFFYRFNDNERKKLGVCIDTAHVHAAGYDPLPYLQHWEKHCPVSIKLVHFNDAAVKCGSCVDRHALPGHGHIGYDKMNAVAKWCNDRIIPMVIE